MTWTPGTADPTLNNGQVTIGGFSDNPAGPQYTFFECTAPAAANQFTIPAWVLATMAQTGSTTVSGNPFPLGFMYIGQYTNPVQFPPTRGLDLGILTTVMFNGYGVSFQ